MWPVLLAGHETGDIEVVCETEHEDPARVGHGPGQNKDTAGQARPLQVSQLELEWFAGSLEFNLASDAEIFILTLLCHTHHPTHPQTFHNYKIVENNLIQGNVTIIAT